MTACAFPDPHVVSYDLLLSYVNFQSPSPSSLLLFSFPRLNGPLSLLPYTRNYLVTPANQCSRILSYLDLFGMPNGRNFTHTLTDILLAESDYTVVFFAAGGHHTPSWNWVWKAYRSLSRKYRKNLKRLVRSIACTPLPNFWFELAYSILCTRLSFRKVRCFILINVRLFTPSPSALFACWYNYQPKVLPKNHVYRHAVVPSMPRSPHAD